MYQLIEVGSFSCPKPNKEINEDFLLLPTYDTESNLVFAVADGVGSSRNAHNASRCVLQRISKTLQEKNFSVEYALTKAKEEIDNLSLEGEEYQDSATTLTLVQIRKNDVIIGHIGDSRAYIKNNNKLIQVTKDHTRYQELLDEGELSVKKLQQHKERLSSVLTKALAKSAKLEFDIIKLPIDDLIQEDTIIMSLMSDGAYNHWQKRAKFSITTMNSPLAFTNSLRKRIEKNPTDDFSCITIKLKKHHL